jgi:hypothetical protein
VSSFAISVSSLMTCLFKFLKVLHIFDSVFPRISQEHSLYRTDRSFNLPRGAAL